MCPRRTKNLVEQAGAMVGDPNIVRVSIERHGVETEDGVHTFGVVSSPDERLVRVDDCDC